MAFTGSSSYEQSSLIGELTQGWDLAKQLKVLMGSEVSDETKRVLLEGILSSYEKSLLILKWRGGSIEPSQQHVVRSPNMPESPISVIGSPKSDDLNPAFNAQQESRDFSRKRKAMSSWTEQVKGSSENALEGPPDDSYSWRKYGQKDILGAKHPRSYYRCTYRNIQNCNATKLVQRDDEDPSAFNITYKGTHTCTLGPRSKSGTTSPEKQDNNKLQNLSTTGYHQYPDVLLNFQTGLSVDVQNLENQEIGFPFSTGGSGYESHQFTPSTLSDNSFYSSFQPSFAPSPATSESNYFSTSPCTMSTFGAIHHGQHIEQELTDIISATTSRTNSPIVGIDFALEQLEFNPSFPYDNQKLFPSLSQAKE